MLRRDSGPAGWIELPMGRVALEGWELFEGDPESPHMCRGWFRIGHFERLDVDQDYRHEGEQDGTDGAE
jgi:hypothetical protein